MELTTQMPLREALNAPNSSLATLVVSESSLSAALAAWELKSIAYAALLTKLREAYRTPEGTVTEVQVADRVELSVKKLERGAFLELALVDAAVNDIELIWEGYRAYPKGALKVIANALAVFLGDIGKPGVSSVAHSEQHADGEPCNYPMKLANYSDSIWSPIVVGWKAKRTQAGNVIEITIEEVDSCKGRFCATLLCSSQKPHVSYFDELREAKETCLQLAGLLLDFTE